ncbi:hypothetical protein PR202_ga23615 [Eleusine coracana subsp. coracana]|uniref:Aspergillus nuclease S1 n=1 Tax=Eleusine coracana subsp. coracana TaxID=191504 RepID=A0AAV5D738_ELECO|nr:hypothetical protein PR202_ga23615 [Eleusine coracana subsp. coracana]
MMEVTAMLLLLLFAALPAPSHGWGGRLSDAAAAAVKDLLPSYAGDDLSSLCSWADDIKFRYHWSSPLHYINTPDELCSYSYDRDCKDEEGVTGRCVAGAINNYTSQLLTYGKSSESSQCNAPCLGRKHHSDGGGRLLRTQHLIYEYVTDDELLNLQGEWSEQVPSWEECGRNQTACPDMYGL